MYSNISAALLPLSMIFHLGTTFVCGIAIQRGRCIIVNWRLEKEELLYYGGKEFRVMVS